MGWAPCGNGGPCTVADSKGIDIAEELVHQFVNLLVARGQSDLVAGAKIAYDGSAVLVWQGE